MWFKLSLLALVLILGVVLNFGGIIIKKSTINIALTILLGGGRQEQGVYNGSKSSPLP